MKFSSEELAAVRASLKGFLADKGAEAYLFGSRVTGIPRPDSDLDILLKRAQEIPFEEIARLKGAFEESPLPFKVDIVDYHRIDETFRRNIMAQAMRVEG
jgi:hypothetical protein